jgi:hypothetical protein
VQERNERRGNWKKYLHVQRFLAVVQPSAITQSAAAAQSLYNQQTERSLTRVNAPIDPRKFYIRIKDVWRIIFKCYTL